MSLTEAGQMPTAKMEWDKLKSLTVDNREVLRAKRDTDMPRRESCLSKAHTQERKKSGTKEEARSIPLPRS